MSRSRLSGLLLALVLVAGLTQTVAAQAPARTKAAVYGSTYFDGMVYGTTMVPPSSGTIYLMADHTNVLTFRQTLIYFWPVTNRYLADWDALNDLIPGTLEILRHNQVVQQVTLDDFVIQYDTGDPLTTLHVYTGAPARQAADRYAQLQLAYREQLSQYSQAQQAWRDQVDKLLQNAPPGTRTPTGVPAAPKAPPTFSISSTDPQRGFAFQLPEGDYTIQLRRTDGTVDPASRMALTMFREQGSAVGYDIVPQQRWTLPESSDQPESVIYAALGTTLYLQPYTESRVDELRNARMREPQDINAHSGRWNWVRHAPVQTGRLRILRGGQTLAEVPLQQFYVQQLPGGALGYDVVLFDPATMDKPTFAGFRVDSAMVQQADSIVMIGDDDKSILGSARPLRLLRSDRTPFIYVLSGLPLVVGIGLLLARRRRLRSIGPSDQPDEYTPATERTPTAAKQLRTGEQLTHES